MTEANEKDPAAPQSWVEPGRSKRRRDPGEAVQGAGAADATRPRVARPTASFRAGVYAVVSRIPAGRVMTYGQVALVLGMPRAARVVGGALHLLDHETDVPWHRVVNRHGMISTRCPEHSMWEQAERLRAEGVAMDATLQLDLARYRWWPDRALLAELGLAPEVLYAVDALLARAGGTQGERRGRSPRPRNAGGRPPPPSIGGRR